VKDERIGMNEHHTAEMNKLRELGKKMACEPLANSSIADVEFAGEKLIELADYCDRLRADYEAREKQGPVVARVTVYGKDWKLHYMCLPVGTHDLYAHSYTYSETSNV
jgi:hypothetical protein